MNEYINIILDGMLALMSTIIMFKLKDNSRKNERREIEKEKNKEYRNQEIVNQIKELKDEIIKINDIQNKQSKCINAIMKDKIYKRCEQLLIIGEVTTDDLKELSELVEPYFSNGGNGIGKASYEKVLQLKRVESYDDKRSD